MHRIEVYDVNQSSKGILFHLQCNFRAIVTSRGRKSSGKNKCHLVQCKGCDKMAYILNILLFLENRRKQITNRSSLIEKI